MAGPAEIGDDGSGSAFFDNDGSLAAVVALMGGPAAERELLGCETALGVAGDWPEILRLLRDRPQRPVWMCARSLIRRHRGVVKAVADALIEHGTLDAAQLDRLVWG